MFNLCVSLWEENAFLVHKLTSKLQLPDPTGRRGVNAGENLDKSAIEEFGRNLTRRARDEPQIDDESLINVAFNGPPAE